MQRRTDTDEILWAGIESEGGDENTGKMLQNPRNCIPSLRERRSTGRQMRDIGMKKRKRASMVHHWGPTNL